jgi:hypothetical protein
MLGDAALTMASIAVAVFSWSTGAIFWILAAIWTVTRLGVWLLRLSLPAARLLGTYAVAAMSGRTPAGSPSISASGFGFPK